MGWQVVHLALLEDAGKLGDVTALATCAATPSQVPAQRLLSSTSISRLHVLLPAQL